MFFPGNVIPISGNIPALVLIWNIRVKQEVYFGHMVTFFYEIHQPCNEYRHKHIYEIHITTPFYVDRHL